MRPAWAQSHCREQTGGWDTAPAPNESLPGTRP